jgi:hypothetical protein
LRLRALLPVWQWDQMPSKVHLGNSDGRRKATVLTTT